MAQYISAKTNEKEYQLLKERFIKSSGSRLIFSNWTKKRVSDEDEIIVGGTRDWLQDIYTTPTIYYYL